MNLDDYGTLFEEALSRTRIAVPEGTLLRRAAEEVFEMAAAYEGDGRVFLRSNDPVNALAGFAYGIGWLDAGLRLRAARTSRRPPPGEIDDCIPGDKSIHLHEKTHRYQRMLCQALAMVEPAPDESEPDTCWFRGFPRCGTLLVWFRAGMPRGGDFAGSSLTQHGYAWLDAGIRAGLLRVTGERGLFYGIVRRSSSPADRVCSRG